MMLCKYCEKGIVGDAEATVSTTHAGHYYYFCVGHKTLWFDKQKEHQLELFASLSRTIT